MPTSSFELYWGDEYACCCKTYAPHGVRFYSPELCFVDAEKYLPAIPQKRGKAADELAATLAYLRTLVVSLDE